MDMFEGSASSSSREMLDQLSETACVLCDPRMMKKTRDPAVPDDRYHAVLVFPDNAPEFIPLATGLLLTTRFKITILRLHFESEDRTKADGKWEEENRENVEGKLRQTHERTVTGIPCGHPVRVRDDASYVLEVDFTMKEQNRYAAGETTCQGPISLEPFELCAIQAAPSTSLLIKNYIPLQDPRDPSTMGKLPDVMITDASLVGALWMAESWGVPTVAVASHSFVPLIVEHDAAWSSQTGGSWFSRIWRLLGQRLHSLSITSAYMEMNRMRLDFGLPQLRRPIDYLAPAVAILMEFAEKDSIPGVNSEKAQNSFADTIEQWERIHVVGPLQPPCFPCDVKSTKQQQVSSLRKTFRDKQSPSTKVSKNHTILVVPPANSTPTWTRNILQGVFLARQSLIRYDDCDWDSLSCQKSVKFKTIWVVKEGEQDYFPPVVQDYVERESYTNLLDSVANHPYTMLAIMPCDKYAAIFEKSLDISVICVEGTERFPLRPDQVPPSATNPREMSAKILHHLRARQQKEQRNPPTAAKAEESTSDTSESSSPPSPDGSLTRAVSIIERVAALNRQNFPWKDNAEMLRVTSQAVKNLTRQAAQNSSSASTTTSVEDEFDWQPPYDTFTVLVAWIVVLVSAVYIAFSPRSLRRSQNGYFLSNHHHHHVPSSGSDGLFTRPDLDDAWAAWLEWYTEQPDSLQLLYHKITGGSSDVSPPDAPHNGPTSPPNNSGQNNRRRKKR
jgi:hypothetical protein